MSPKTNVTLSEGYSRQRITEAEGPPDHREGMSRTAAPAFASALRPSHRGTPSHQSTAARNAEVVPTPPIDTILKPMREPRRYFTYIMASRSRVLYTGITNNIVRRTAQHRKRQSDSFTAEHRCTLLVWYQVFSDPLAAIAREKQIKGWRRSRKIALIEDTNPFWHDLSAEWGKPITFPISEQHRPTPL